MAALLLTRGWMSQDASAPLLGLSFLICNLKGLDEKPQGSPSSSMAKGNLEKELLSFQKKLTTQCWHKAAPKSSFKPSVLTSGGGLTQCLTESGPQTQGTTVALRCLFLSGLVICG